MIKRMYFFISHCRNHLILNQTYFHRLAYNGNERKGTHKIKKTRFKSYGFNPKNMFKPTDNYNDMT